MINSTHSPQIQSIPLDKLKGSDDNVRRMPHNKAQIEALANSIQAHGQIQNLLVKTETDETGGATGFYLVTAGEGRRLAQLCRVKRKQIKADEPISCVIDDTRNAVAVSLAENEIRQTTMHPADQFVAFKNLVDAGQSMDEIAAQFSVTPLIVQRRLKLANVAPEFIESYRKGTVALDVLMALALTDDHEKQREVWASLRKHERHAAVVRQRLTHQEIAIDEPMVRFVGLKAYCKAGGQIRRDLFADEESEGYVMDAELLRKLAADKLQQEATKIQAEGYAWVEITPNLDYATMAEYRHVQRVSRNPTGAEAASLAQLEAERATLETATEDAEDDDDGQFADIQARIEAIDTDIDTLQEHLAVPKPDEQAVAGVLISIGHDGKLRVERDLIKPEDRARFDRAVKVAHKATKSEGPPIHSAALTRRLSAHRTLGVQVALCEQPAIALAALTHRLALQVFYGHARGSGSAVQVGPEVVDLNGYGEDVKNSPARAALLAHLEQCRQRLPVDADGLLPWLLAHSEAEGLNLLACCVAVTVDGVQGGDTYSMDALARATALDMRKWWSATAETYFGSVPKARILEVVREAVSPEVASAMTDLKKGELVASAEQRLVGRGWLPPSFKVMGV
jgi:ParB family transcriptional regulator, chromosome partitioning protein